MALEKEAAGVLSTDERGDLARHVGDCAACQRVQGLITSLRTMAPPESSSSAMDVVRSRVARRQRHLWMHAALLASLSAAAFVVFSPTWGAIHIALGIAVIGGEVFKQKKLDRRVAENAQSATELIGAMREETQKHIAMLERKHLWLIAGGWVVLGVQALGRGDLVLGGYFIGLSIFMGAALVRAQRVHLPRLRRELLGLTAES